MHRSGFVTGLAVLLGVVMLSLEGETLTLGGLVELPLVQAPAALSLANGQQQGVGLSLLGQDQVPTPFNGSEGINLGSLPLKTHVKPGIITQAKCDIIWVQALLNIMLNYNNWKCSTRTNAAGTVENCVLTGIYPNPNPTPAVVNTRCGWIKPVFCDDSVNDIVNSLLSANPANSVVPATPSGYTLVPGSSFYKVHTEKLSWTAAQSACKAEGGNLAVPITSNDYTVIMNLLVAAGVPPGGVYIGFTDTATEGTFVSVTGQPSCQLAKIPYTNGEPNNNGDEDCLVFGASNVATVNDIICSEVNAFVCQIILPSRLAMCRQ